jgi:hypothetical protein
MRAKEAVSKHGVCRGVFPPSEQNTRPNPIAEAVAGNAPQIAAPPIDRPTEISNIQRENMSGKTVYKIDFLDSNK